MDFALRKATATDIPYLLELRDITMRRYLEETGSPTSQKAYLERIMLHFEDANIIEVDGHSAGLFKATFLPKTQQWFVVQIQVHPDYQNHHIGSRLLRDLINRAKQEQVAVTLGVLKSNPARSLYERLGFRAVAETEFEYEMLLAAPLA